MKKFLYMLVLMISVGLVQNAFAGTLSEDRTQADYYLKSKDYRKAFKAYLRLAKDGDHDSQFRVSKMYFEGLGTRGDLIDAYAWSTLAAETKMEKLQNYSDDLLAQIEDKRKARFEAEKLQKKYGKEALAEVAERLEARRTGFRPGSCTGSRLRCRGVNAYDMPATNMPVIDPGGGN